MPIMELMKKILVQVLEILVFFHLHIKEEHMIAVQKQMMPVANGAQQN